VLDFLTTTSLDSRITFTRATTATFVGSNGLIQTAAINAPRFDYNPITLAAKGLLIEEQRTNILLYSEQFDNAAWTKSGSTISANATTAPDGTLTADKLQVANTANSQKNVNRTIGAISTTYTDTVYAKASELNWLIINQYDGSDRRTSFNLSNGTVGTTAAGTTATIEALPNGWYRCRASRVTGTGSIQLVINLANADNSAVFVGVVGQGIFLWGVQREAGAFATSYIPTVASQVTRSADVATMTGTNFSSWFNPSEGTFVASYGASPNLFATYLAASNGVVSQNSIHFDNDSGGTMRSVYYSGSVAQATLSLGAYGAAGTVNTVASAYAVNDFAASRNGAAVVTDTSGALPISLTQLNIGADPSGAAVNVTNSHIRSIRYYNKRLYNQQLQTLSQ
jgi:hypothetical protein